MAESKKRIRRKVTKEETAIASSLGGRRTFNSGAGDEKGDGRVLSTYQIVDGHAFEQNVSYRIENKITTKRTYRLRAADWAKLRDAAMKTGETAVFCVKLPGMGRAGVRLVAIPYSYAQVIGNAPSQDDADPSGSFVMSTDLWFSILHGSEYAVLVDPKDDRKRRHAIAVMRWDVFQHHISTE